MTQRVGQYCVCDCSRNRVLCEDALAAVANIARELFSPCGLDQDERSERVGWQRRGEVPRVFVADEPRGQEIETSECEIFGVDLGEAVRSVGESLDKYEVQQTDGAAFDLLQQRQQNTTIEAGVLQLYDDELHVAEFRC